MRHQPPLIQRFALRSAIPAISPALLRIPTKAATNSNLIAATIPI